VPWSWKGLRLGLGLGFERRDPAAERSVEGSSRPPSLVVLLRWSEVLRKPASGHLVGVRVRVGLRARVGVGVGVRGLGEG
jgi:hypothetical protein